MAPRLRSLPDVLVLGAGGAVGIAWLRGLLAGLEEAADLDLRRCEYFVGTSAGAYVGAYLAAGRRPTVPEELRDVATELPGGDGADAGPRPDDGDTEATGSDAGEHPADGGPLRRAGRFAAALTAPAAPLALRATRPGGAAARAALLRVGPRRDARTLDLGSYVRDLGTFDGRLRIATVDRATGRRVMFGSPRAPDAPVAEAVLASCSVPWVFPPVTIGDREYVDGGVWSMSNLDAAPVGRQAEVLALLPTFGRAGRGGAALLRAAGQAVGLAELQVLRSRGARTRIVSPDAASFAAMGPRLMDGARRDDVLLAAREQGRRLAG